MILFLSKMETRRKLAIIGLPILVFFLTFPLIMGWIKLVDISQIIITALVSGIVGLAVYGFKPKDRPVDDNEVERIAAIEQRVRLEMEEKFRERTSPTLEFGTITKFNEAEVRETFLLGYTAYYIDVNKVQGIEHAEQCEGRISITGTQFINHSTIWKNNKSKYEDIGLTSQLLLFRIEEQQNYLYLIKPSNTKDTGIEITTYKDKLDKEITVQVMTKKGFSPTPLKKKISEIISEAKSID